MLDHHPARGRAAAPERVHVALRVGRGRLREVEVDVHGGAGAGAAREPRVEVDEDGADELAVLERGVAGDVGVVHCELDDLGGFGAADEGVDCEAGVVAGLDVGWRGRVEGRVVDYGAVERDGLNLSPAIVKTPLYRYKEIAYEVVLVAHALMEVRLLHTQSRGLERVVDRP